MPDIELTYFVTTVLEIRVKTEKQQLNKIMAKGKQKYSYNVH